MQKSYLILILVMFLLLPAGLYGQAKVATTGAQFLEIGVSSRAVGMGEAFIALSDDVTAVYYNPAGLTQIPSTEIAFTHIDYIADINYDFGAIAVPVWALKGVLGFGFYMFNGGDLMETTYEYPSGTGRTFGVKEYALSASYAHQFTDHLSFGLTFKLIESLYENERTLGFAGDVGTIYNTGFRGFKLAIALTNFGTNMVAIKEPYSLPIAFKFGGTFNIVENEKHLTVLALEGSHPSDNMDRFAFGLEYSYKNMFFLRIGQKFEIDAGGFSAGGGVYLPLKNYTLKLDYGFFDFGILESAHRFTVGFNFN